MCAGGRVGHASPRCPSPNKSEQQHMVSRPFVCPERSCWKASEVSSRGPVSSWSSSLCLGSGMPQVLVLPRKLRYRVGSWLGQCLG